MTTKDTPQRRANADSYGNAAAQGVADYYDKGTAQPGQTVAFAPYTDAYPQAASSDAYDDAFAPEDDDFGFEDEEPGKGRSRRGKGGRGWFGGAFSRVQMGRVDMRSGKEDETPVEGDNPEIPQPESPEMQKIYQFRNPDIDTEVWFVALGAELNGNSGMRAFIAEHGQELRGSIIIELEALGAGDLCVTESEGMYRTAKTSSRMRRYTRKATQATGVQVGSAHMRWKDSSSSYAIGHGLQAMHLVGMDGAKPAHYGESSDTPEAVDGGLLAERVNFVMELLKSI